MIHHHHVLSGLAIVAVNVRGCVDLTRFWLQSKRLFTVAEVQLYVDLRWILIGLLELEDFEEACNITGHCKTKRKSHRFFFFSLSSHGRFSNRVLLMLGDWGLTAHIPVMVPDTISRLISRRVIHLEFRRVFS